MKAHFVTCMYNGLHHSELCGRLNRDRPYQYSMSAIAGTGEKIICYTSPAELTELKRHFNSFAFPNMELLEWDLYAMPFHNEVNIVRNREAKVYREAPDWRDRCVEIMWGKFLFLKESIKNNQESEYVYWIDAGISHGGIIHSRFNTHYEHNIGFVRDLDKSTYPDTFRNDLIFDENFMQHLINYTEDDKILNIAARGPQHPRLKTNNAFKGSVIGGIFGGKRDLVVQYCDEVILQFETHLKEGKLCKEEQIMTEILSDEIIPVKHFRFDTWYHPDWENRYNESQVSFCDFFDEIKK